MTIKDSVGDGVLKLGGERGIGVFNSCTLYLEDVTVSASSSQAAIFSYNSELCYSMIYLTDVAMASSGQTALWLDANSGAVLTNCKISTTYAGEGYALYCPGCSLDMKNVDIDARGTSCCGIALLSSFMAKLTECTIHTSDRFCMEVNENGTISTHLNISGGTYTADQCAAIYLPDCTEAIISDAAITGSTGIEIRRGTLGLNNCTVTGTNGSYTYEPSDEGNTVYGPAVAVSQNTAKQDVSVEIDEGSYSATNAPAVAQLNLNSGTAEDAKKISLAITAGDFTGYSETSESTALDLQSFKDMNASITGGTYSSDVAAYVCAPYVSKLIPDSGGRYEVVEDTTTCAASVADATDAADATDTADDATSAGDGSSDASDATSAGASAGIDSASTFGVQTGDDTGLVLAIAIVLLAASALVAAASRGKRGKRNGRCGE